MSPNTTIRIRMYHICWERIISTPLPVPLSWCTIGSNWRATFHRTGAVVVHVQVGEEIVHDDLRWGPLAFGVTSLIAARRRCSNWKWPDDECLRNKTGAKDLNLVKNNVMVCICKCNYHLSENKDFGSKFPSWFTEWWSLISWRWTNWYEKFMLCLVGVNDSGRNGMKNELSYGWFLRNFIPSSIPFLTSYVR